MTCCGKDLVEITTQDDLEPIFLCVECGRSGTALDFPDKDYDSEPPLNWRGKLAGLLHRLADRIQ